MIAFQDRVVLVTGAGGGIGREIAAPFAPRGARVALNDLTPVNLDPTVAEIRESGGVVAGYLADIAKKIPGKRRVEKQDNRNNCQEKAVND